MFVCYEQDPYFQVHLATVLFLFSFSVLVRVVIPGNLNFLFLLLLLNTTMIFASIIFFFLFVSVVVVNLVFSWLNPDQKETIRSKVLKLVSDFGDWGGEV